jgi:hypothetical protein
VPASGALREFVEQQERAVREATASPASAAARFQERTDFLRNREAELAKEKAEIDEESRIHWTKLVELKEIISVAPTPEMIDLVRRTADVWDRRVYLLRSEYDRSLKTLEMMLDSMNLAKDSREILRDSLLERTEGAKLRYEHWLRQWHFVLAMQAEFDPEWPQVAPKLNLGARTRTHDHALAGDWARVPAPAALSTAATVEAHTMIARYGILVSAFLIGGGFVLGLAAPGPLTGALFVVGLGLWWAVADYARRYDLA